MVTEFILPFAEIGRGDRRLAGGKGANLGEMARAGLPVPPGFCVTTRAYEHAAEQARLEPLVAELDQIPADAVDSLTALARSLRDRIESAPIPPAIAQAVASAYRQLGDEVPAAVRSSASAEDLPGLSFAGQHDTYLNVVGADAVLTAVRRCWASLWTDRAVMYRARNQIAHSLAAMAVVVQRVASSEISGILFTADPVTGDRSVCSIEASYGLGEALVSGRVNADVYRLRRRTGELLDVRVGDKAVAVWPLPGGGTQERPVPEDQRRKRVLDDAALARLAALGGRVDSHYGTPQDIEWCIENGQLYLVQARPITSLFPLPEPRPRDNKLHVYFSIGHMQVNTAALPPMSASLLSRVFPLGDYVARAGGRVYVDLTPILRDRMLRAALPEVLDEFAPGVAADLRAASGRSDFSAQPEDAKVNPLRLLPVILRLAGRVLAQFTRPDLDKARAAYEAALAAKVAGWNAVFSRAEPGLPRLRAACGQLERMALELIPLFMPVLSSGALSMQAIRALMGDRVDSRTVDALGRGLAGNVTTDMILQAGDLADLAREVPVLSAHLRTAAPETAIQAARSLPGAEPFFTAWDRFIERYGHRCPTENDFAQPRWRENPASLVRMLAGMLETRETGAHRRKFASAVAEAQAAAQLILQATPRPAQPLVNGLIQRARAYLALREHHRFAFAHLFMHARRAVLEAGRVAVRRGFIREVDEVWFLELDELAGLLDGSAKTEAMRDRIERRKEEHARFARMTPPRLLTSDGEILKAAGQTALPPGILAGLGASAGVAEGIARVVVDPTRETVRPGEILVAPFTDPGWTPLFVNASALVMEVGGMMTHGSVIAREYGLPAVVGVEGATHKIHTGQRLRVDGGRGRVAILDKEAGK